MVSADKKLEIAFGIVASLLLSGNVFFINRLIGDFDAHKQNQTAQNAELKGELVGIKIDLAVIKSGLARQALKDAKYCDAPRFLFREASIQLKDWGKNEESNQSVVVGSTRFSFCSNR